jgi:hypothetical protein
VATSLDDWLNALVTARDRDDVVTAMERLQAFGAEAVPALQRVARDPAVGPGGRSRAVDTLATLMPARRETVELLTTLLRDDAETQVRWSAATALGRLGDTSVVPALEQALQTDSGVVAFPGFNLSVREAATASLARLGRGVPPGLANRVDVPTDSFLRRTRQLWKLVVAGLVLPWPALAAGWITLSRIGPDQSLGEWAVGLGVIAATAVTMVGLLAAVRCPSCGARLMARVVRAPDFHMAAAVLLGTRVCPWCRWDPGRSG